MDHYSTCACNAERQKWATTTIPWSLSQRAKYNTNITIIMSIVLPRGHSGADKLLLHPRSSADMATAPETPRESSPSGFSPLCGAGAAPRSRRRVSALPPKFWRFTYAYCCLGWAWMIATSAKGE